MGCVSVGVLVLLGILTFLYLLGIKQKKYFEKYDVPFRSVRFPIIRDLWGIVYYKQHLKDQLLDMHLRFHNKKFYGDYLFTTPNIFIRDVELLKEISVRDFDSFHDHHFNVDEKDDRMMGLFLFTMKGQKWKDMRSTISPAFTSSKMRHMFQFITESAENTITHLLKEADCPHNKESGLVKIEMKDLATRYLNDVIASAVFGLKTDSLNEPKNYFYQMGLKITNMDAITNIKFLFAMIKPKLLHFFNTAIFDKEATNFFFDLVANSMKERESKNIKRPDMINILIEAKNGTLKHENHSNDKDISFATVDESDYGKESVKREWKQDELIAQAVGFFFAGFESSSTLICFIAYELAVHPEIQERLQREIDDVAAENNGKLEYQDLQRMKYMDMVVSETLRKWPPTVLADRKCMKQYTLPPAHDSVKYTLEVGQVIQIPIYAIQHDPEYFPDPEKFDPERFSDENKSNINPFAFIPFGMGPRNCIGSRFALMKAKALVFYLLDKFDIVATEDTQIPIKLEKTSFTLRPERGFRFGLRPRKFNT